MQEMKTRIWLLVLKKAIYNESCGIETMNRARALAVLAVMSVAALPAMAATTCRPGLAGIAAQKRIPYSLITIDQAKAAASTPGTNLLIGDSFANLWPRPLIDMATNGQTNNLGVVQDMTSQVLWRMQSLPLPAAARTIVVQVGVNNLWRDQACDIASAIQAIVTGLRHHYQAPSIYVMAVLPFGPRMQTERKKALELDDILSAQAASGGFRFVDDREDFVLQCSTSDSCSLLRPDHLHPSLEGYMLMTKRLNTAVTAH